MIRTEEVAATSCSQIHGYSRRVATKDRGVERGRLERGWRVGEVAGMWVLWY